MDIRLDGKVAIVTGGSRGIGKGIAKVYAESGAQVMITSRSEESCKEAAEEIGHGCAYVPGHIGKDADADRVVQETMDRFGKIDVLVNNAATNPYAGKTIKVDRARWDKTFETNVTAPMFWSQRVWNASMKEAGGSILNISSIGGLATNPILGVYDITKAAVIHLTQQLAAELGPHVRVNCIAPGLVKTDFAKVLWADGRGEQVAKGVPLERLGEPEDLGWAACFLAAEQSRWITGQTWVLDGGALIAFKDQG